MILTARAEKRTEWCRSAGQLVPRFLRLLNRGTRFLAVQKRSPSRRHRVGSATQRMKQASCLEVHLREPVRPTVARSNLPGVLSCADLRKWQCLPVSAVLPTSVAEVSVPKLASVSQRSRLSQKAYRVFSRNPSLGGDAEDRTDLRQRPRMQRRWNRPTSQPLDQTVLLLSLQR